MLYKLPGQPLRPRTLWEWKQLMKERYGDDERLFLMLIDYLVEV